MKDDVFIRCRFLGAVLLALSAATALLWRANGSDLCAVLTLVPALFSVDALSRAHEAAGQQEKKEQKKELRSYGKQKSAAV